MNSPRLSPAACMRSSTCPTPGSGTGTSRRITTAFVPCTATWYDFIIGP